MLMGRVMGAEVTEAVAISEVAVILVVITVTLMAGTIEAVRVLLLIGVIMVVGATVGRGSIGDGHGHIPTSIIIGDGPITTPIIGGGPIPITLIIQKLFPRHIVNQKSSNPIIGTSVRTRRVTTLISRIVRAVG
jgi:hypothetical protein